MAGDKFNIKDIFRVKQKSPATTVSIDDIAALMKSMGFDVARDAKGGIVPVPADMNSTETPSFANAWNKLFDEVGANAENREVRMKSYEKMDASGAESSLVLDTYADEVLNIVDSSRYSIRVEISDKTVEKNVKSCLEINGVWERAREDIRSLCKHGDFAYTIGLKGTDQIVRRLDEATTNGTKISNPFRPEDVVLSFVKAPHFELDSTKTQIYKLKASREAPAPFSQKEYNPWEFVFCSIGNRDTYPYGISILERVRLPWEQLTVLEQLLAITRANKIDRIAISVPSGTGDVTSVLKRLSMLKNFMKTVVLNMNTAQRMTRNQDLGLTDYLWIPDSFKVDKLATSINTASIDDVNYFRDKYYNAARLPKGFFLAETGDTNTRPHSLRQQDIKFSRTLIPVQDAYCLGMEKLITIVAFYLGADISEVKVKVTLKKSPYISTELVTTFSDVINLINSYALVRQTIDPKFKITPKQIAQILDMTGTPRELFFGDDKNPVMESQLLDEEIKKALLEVQGMLDTYSFTNDGAVIQRGSYPSLIDACRIV